LSNKDKNMGKTSKFVCPHCGKPIDASLFFAWRSKQLGEMTSEKKAKSSAENGKKGGRPPKEKK
jgi:hypothetical protein